MGRLLWADGGLAASFDLCGNYGLLLRLILAFLEVDFTTEGKQLDRRCRFAYGAYKGTPTLGIEGCVLWLERKIAIHPALIRVRENVNGSVRRSDGFDVAGMAGEVVLPFSSEVARVLDLAAI